MVNSGRGPVRRRPGEHADVPEPVARGPSLVVLPTDERNHTNDSDDMTYPDGYTHMYALRTENRWLAPSTGRSPTTCGNRSTPARCGQGTSCQPSHSWPPPTAHPAARSG